MIKKCKKEFQIKKFKKRNIFEEIYIEILDQAICKEI